ncbi:hypothetical protein MKZ38_002864 [Zalerion maritima]|uniref:HNH domain-containing protein n=1 Tax=Zalerion maritima TaxID=339359 RepID=A0AAD5RX96_9PEZI|nr:hypothetical protein MKZ38_002864 [Zalerion maritima]
MMTSESKPTDMESSDNFQTFLETLAGVLGDRFDRPTKSGGGGGVSKSKAKRKAVKARRKKSMGGENGKGQERGGEGKEREREREKENDDCSPLKKYKTRGKGKEEQMKGFEGDEGRQLFVYDPFTTGLGNTHGDLEHSGLKGLNEHDAEPRGEKEGDAENAREDLQDFIHYIAVSIFSSLPDEVRTLNYYDWKNDPKLQSEYNPSLLTSDMAAERLLSSVPGEVPDSLSVYSILNTPSGETLSELLVPVLQAYITEAFLTAPPVPRQTKDLAQESGCEICERDWVFLTYHHLIPRSVHDKVLKKGWHKKHELGNVAWLCRACHSFVHHFASNEELARKYFTVELLAEEGKVQEWAKWVGRIRWKGSTRMK